MVSQGSAALPAPGLESSGSLARAHTDEDVSPREIAVGVIIGRSSEYFDFFVFGIASVLVFPSVLFPFLSRLDGTLMAFAIFSLAFVARPVGTAISMAVQRRWGRGTKLTLALFARGVSNTPLDEQLNTNQLLDFAILMHRANQRTSSHHGFQVELTG